MRRFDVYGRLVGVEWLRTYWRVVYLGAEGKHRVAEDIVIPPSVVELQAAAYLVKPAQLDALLHTIETHRLH